MKLHWCDTRCRCCPYYIQWVKQHTQSCKWGLTLWQNIIRMKFPMLISLIILKSTADLVVYSNYVLLSPLSTLLAVNVWNLDEMSSIKCFLKSFFFCLFNELLQRAQSLQLNMFSVSEPWVTSTKVLKSCSSTNPVSLKSQQRHHSPGL